MYKVLRDFADKCDNLFEYSRGQSYPRTGYEPSAGRIDELLGSNNALKTPIIEKVSEKAVEKTVEKKEDDSGLVIDSNVVAAKLADKGKATGNKSKTKK